MGVSDLDKITEHPVIFDLQWRDTGWFFLLSLHGGDYLFCISADSSQLIKISVVSIFDKISVIDVICRIFSDGRIYEVDHFFQIVKTIDRISQNVWYEAYRFFFYLRNNVQRFFKCQKVEGESNIQWYFGVEFGKVSGSL